MPCHQSHNNIAGMVEGDCSKCHKLGDPLGRRTVSWLRPLDSTFDHWSRGHNDSQCTDCHTQVAGAETLAGIKVPTEAREACIRCHVNDRQRFHWQGVKGNGTK